MSYSEYKDLAPIDNVENGDEYFEALNWAFKNKKVKNIALTGPYGAGKSSVIETFLQKNEKSQRYIEKLTKGSIRKNAIKISMATFFKANGTAEEQFNEKIEVDANEVEKGILKQLFYKVQPNKIPQSRYRKLHRINSKITFVGILIALLLMMLFVAIFAPSQYKNFVEAITNFISPKFTGTKYTACATILLLLLVSGIATFLYRGVNSKFKIKEVKLPSDMKIQSGEEETESVFNKNLDEIMYFFETTGYQTVFFEDLDRLDDPKIFVHLRELNNLLNNDDAIKNKPIVFVYAVRDDIFSKEDRTKFFDFIIPIIPVINATNSGEILLQRLIEAKNNGIEHDISQGFVLDISPFISDMRILQNIYNEFVVYKKTLRTSQELNLSDEQMLAIIVVKNLYPSDFADLQNEKGVLKKALIDKNDFIAKKKQEIQKRIDEYSTVITDFQKDVLKSIAEIKYAMLGALMGGPHQFIAFNNSSWGDSGVSASIIMDDSYDMTKLIENEYKYIHFTNQNGQSSNQSLSMGTITPYIDRWRAIKEVEVRGLENLQNDLEKLKESQHKLSGMSIVEILRKYSVDEVFSEKVRANSLLVFLLRRGYLDEKYACYINYFKGTSITKDDMNFILSVKNQIPLAFDYQLTKVSRVIERLQEYEFEQKTIYNFDLMEQLLEGQFPEKLMLFLEQLSDEDETSWKFIDEFISKTSYQEKFIRALAEKWPEMWNYISANKTLTYDRQLLYLKMILSESELSTIENQNIDGCMTRYFEEHDDILQKLTSTSCDVAKIISVLDSLKVHFSSLRTANVPDEILNSVFGKCHYVLNADMIKTIVSYEDNGQIGNLEKQPYSTLVMLDYTPLLQYVHDNIKPYVSEIVLAHNKLNDRPDDIVDLLTRLEDEQEIQIKLIQQEDFCLEHIEECANESVHAERGKWLVVWSALLKENAVTINWENIFAYWMVYQFNDELKSYVSDHEDELAGMDTSIISDEFIKAFIQSNLANQTKEKLLPVLRLRKFDLDIASLDQNTLQIMVDCNYFEFIPERYDSIYSVFPDIAVKFILKNQNQYMMLRETIPMTSNLFERLILSADFEKENRNKIFSDYAETYITETVVRCIKSLSLPMTKNIFNSAWNSIDEQKRKELLLDYYKLLDADELQQRFEELGNDYEQFAKRAYRHDVSLPLTTKNEDFAKYLERIGYITSYSIKEEKEFDMKTRKMKEQKVLKLRIKKVR